jgi:hypothetical protein
VAIGQAAASESEPSSATGISSPFKSRVVGDNTSMADARVGTGASTISAECSVIGGTIFVGVRWAAVFALFFGIGRVAVFAPFNTRGVSTITSFNIGWVAGLTSTANRDSPRECKVFNKDVVGKLKIVAGVVVGGSVIAGLVGSRIKHRDFQDS